MNYFISDCHFSHDNILKFRTQFKTIKEHDEYILNNILKIANKRATLYLLGDCFIFDSTKEFLKELSKNFLKIKLILGNHDFERTKQFTLKGALNEFPNLEAHGFIKYKEFYLSHCPIIDNRGKVNIHGHLHSNSLENKIDFFNVSCEAIDYKPITLESIRNKLNEFKLINKQKEE